jgi:4-hydroxythreonine-4-phosphate dehydrogenase
MQAVDEAARAAMTGEVSAIVTAPIDKLHWRLAGSPFAGHTEYLAHISGAKSVAMMMTSDRLSVVLVTTHLPLSEVPKNITEDGICGVAALAHESLTGRANKKIAVCGLNPHAGDGGTFGNEEERVIRPAIRRLYAQGIDASGPFSADTIFHKAVMGEFGAVVAMYHDQGLVPIKTLDFQSTVNVTLGLPFVRTSPDHGTARDIAGKGIADHRNMVRAIEKAVELVMER